MSWGWSGLDTRCLVIFDCDGVLVDSEILACDVQARALAEYGLSLTGADVARRFLGVSARDMRAALEVDLGRSLPDDHETRCGAELFDLFRRELKPVQGISRDRVCAPRDRTTPAAWRRVRRPSASRLPSTWPGSTIISGPNVFSSTLVKRGKPAPDLFLHAADAMGFPPSRCIVVEDSVNGVKAALSAGMLALGFLGGTHCPPDHGEDLARAGANRICRNASELMQTLCPRPRGFARLRG